GVGRRGWLFVDRTPEWALQRHGERSQPMGTGIRGFLGITAGPSPRASGGEGRPVRQLLLLALVDDESAADPSLGGELRGPLVPRAGNAHLKGAAVDLVNPQDRLPLALPLGESNVDRLGLLRRVELDGPLVDHLVSAPDRNLARPVAGRDHVLDLFFAELLPVLLL